MLTNEKRKELLKKRKYYREHPEEAHEECLKRDDGIGMVAVDSLPSKKNDYNPEIIDGKEYYMVLDDTVDIGKEFPEITDEDEKAFHDELMARIRKEYNIKG